MISVIGIGDNVVDFYEKEGVMYPGGNALNFSVMAKELGAVSAYMGSFGDDEAGGYVYETVKELGVDLSHCRFLKGENGRCHVVITEGEREFSYSNQGGISKKYPLCITKVDLDYIKKFDWVHTSVFSCLDQELLGLKKAGMRISYDFSEHYTEILGRQVCPHLTCACLSASLKKEEELFLLAKEIHDFGCPMVLITCGSRGSALSLRGRWYRQSACPVAVKDTMGAGDYFLTAFLVRYLEAMQYAEDFSGGKEGIVTKKDYEDSIIRSALAAAAVAAARNCLRPGSFGFGKKV